MDLPTTDPGSDLCDLTDSADESFVRSEGREYDGTSNNIEMNVYVGICYIVHACPAVVWRNTQEYRKEVTELSERDMAEKEEPREKTLILPEIMRPRSVSFGELLPCKDHWKTQQRPRCLRYDCFFTRKIGRILR